MVGSSSLMCSSRRSAFFASVFLVVFLIGSSCAFPLMVDVRGAGAATTKTRSSTALSAERRPWNVFQFVQQSARFVNPFQTTKATEERVIQPGDVLWKAGRRMGMNAFTFGPLDDVVMGGASSSSFDEATGKWKGQVTDANNGGFVGIRSTPFVDWDMSQCQGIELQLTTTSVLRLKIVVRDSTEFNGIGWTTSSDIGGGGGRSVKIPFSKQIPTLFAKTVSGQTFSKDQVKALQFTYSKFEYDGALNPKFSLGDFQVQVEEIRAY
jgi:hypothetical protein